MKAIKICTWIGTICILFIISATLDIIIESLNVEKLEWLGGLLLYILGIIVTCLIFDNVAKLCSFIFKTLKEIFTSVL